VWPTKTQHVLQRPKSRLLIYLLNSKTSKSLQRLSPILKWHLLHHRQSMSGRLEATW